MIKAFSQKFYLTGFAFSSGVSNVPLRTGTLWLVIEDLAESIDCARVQNHAWVWTPVVDTAIVIGAFLVNWASSHYWFYIDGCNWRMVKREKDGITNRAAFRCIEKKSFQITKSTHFIVENFICLIYCDLKII